MMVIFDLDGTLWDAAETIAESWNIEIERAMGRPGNITADGLRRNMGKTMNEIADDLMGDLPEEERYMLARRCEVFENEYVAQHGGELFPGVRETLEELLDKGTVMAVVSNCQEGYVRAFIESMDMSKYFADYEEWGRSGLLKAGNIRLVMERNNQTRAVYVGDIQKDADASHEAGVPCIWAAYGFGQISDPDAVIDSFDELLTVLEDLDEA